MYPRHCTSQWSYSSTGMVLYTVQHYKTIHRWICIYIYIYIYIEAGWLKLTMHLPANCRLMETFRYCNNNIHWKLYDIIDQSWTVLQVHGYLFGFTSTGINTQYLKYLKICVFPIKVYFKYLYFQYFQYFFSV